jgi:hypothetical protein
MFEQAPVQVSRLSYSIRGPEWGFAVPQGDLDALEDVIRICSSFWNGIGSLIIPTRSDGRIYHSLDRALEVREVDQVLVHDRVGERAQESLRARLKKVRPLTGSFDQHEIHPLFLSLNDRDEVLSKIQRPLLVTRRLRRVALATWGHIPDEDLEEWRKRFLLLDVRELDALRNLLSAQLHGNCPLYLGGRYMNSFEQSGGLDGWPCLFVFGEAGFDEIVHFWNLRSRLSSFLGSRPIVGVPRELLSALELGSIRRWVEMPVGATHYKPDITLVVPDRERLAARTALEDLGFTSPGDRVRFQHSFPNPPEGREGLEYFEMASGQFGGPMKRGAGASTLATVTDRSISLDLPPPDGVKLPFGHVRLAVRGLPLSLPLNATTAAQIIPNAYASQDGLTVLTQTAQRWSWDVRLPDQAEALEQWASSYGYIATPSQPGLYGQALLGRLRSPDDLNSLADEIAIAILDQLAPKSTKKLAQRLKLDLEDPATPTNTSLDEERLVAMLRDQGLLLGVEAKTLHQIASRAELSQPELVAPLARLVEAGLARRGVSFRCPRCHFLQLVPLGDLDERIQCQACRLELVTPVLKDTEEHPPSYFLDGLTARLMEQDLLSVILALRRARLDVGEAHSFSAWPGLLFNRSEAETDADLLVSNGELVTLFECKANAPSLRLSQAKKLLTLCEAVEARPALAALKGEFAEPVADAVTKAGGLIYLREDLLIKSI